MARESLKRAIWALAEEADCDAEAGDLNDPPFRKARLYRDAFDVADMIDDESVSDQDLDFLREQCGFVIIAKTNEELTIKFFKDEDALEDYWEDISSDLDSDSEHDDGGESEDYDSLGDE